jgi:hypothetical protein
MGYHSKRARHHAAVAYEAHPGNLKAAVTEFKQRCKKAASEIKCVYRFVKRWGQRMLEEGCTDEALKSGRPTKLPQPLLQKCIKTFVKGMKWRNTYKPFTSINHAVNESAELKQVCSDYDIKPKNLLAMMKRARKSLRKVKKRVRPPFSQELKNERMAVAAQLQHKDANYFKRIFYIDAKKIHVLPEKVAVWVDTKRDELVLEDQRAKSSGRNGVVLNFYAMVNALVGPVAIAFTTGTSGITGYKNKVYKVRSAHIPQK